jgi:ABC-type sugar transport system substrate-binding protein
VPIVTRPDRAQQLARLGRVTGDFIVADGAGKANVLLVRYAGDPSGATAMTAARRRVDTTCPDCRTRLIRVAAGQASEQIVAAIQRDPHIDYVGLEDGSMATGLADALQSAGLSGCACSPVNPRGAQQLRVVGINASRQTLESVADGDGTMRAFVQGPSARWLAYAGLDAVARRLVGDPRQRIAMPIEIVTKQTIAAAPARELAPDVPADLAGQFAALWLVP